MKMTNLLIQSLILLVMIRLNWSYEFRLHYETKKARCLNPPRTARRVESVIEDCQEEVKNKLVNEAYEIIKEQVAKVQAPLDIHDDTIEFFEALEIPPTSASDLDDFQPHPHPHSQHNVHHSVIPSSTNGSHYEYLVYDEPPPRRIAQLVRKVRRLDVVTNGIYHPTLVPLEDKRIAGCLLHCVYAKNNAIDKLGWPTLDGLVGFYSEGVNEHGFFMATLRSVNLCLRAVTNKYHIDRKKLPQKGESCDLAFDVFDCISDQITGYCLDHYRY